MIGVSKDLRQLSGPAVAVFRRTILGIAAVGVLTGCALSAPGEGAEAEPAGDTPQGEEHTADLQQDAVQAQAVEPDRVVIPDIELDEPLIDLAIQPDGRLEAPSDWDDVGWFAGGSKLGAGGPTVIAGHVDSPTGPAVFYRLMELEEQDRVTVIDADGGEHLYQVESTADFPKDDFPTQEVFGAGPEDELRLITCTGEFDAEAERHLDNRVVFASRVE